MAEVNGEDVRLVMIPISKKLFSVDELKGLTKELR